jgi:ribosomal subunit interface protein
MALQTHFLDMPPSEAVEAKIRARVDRLSRYCKRIQNCEVWLASQRRPRKTSVYGVRILLTVPQEAVVVDLQPCEDDVYLAVRVAFDAARRKIQDYERRHHPEARTRSRCSDAPRRRAVPESDESGAAQDRSTGPVPSG